MAGVEEVDWRPVRLVLFDAVGTLLHPDPAVDVAYHAAGSRQGSCRSIEQVRERFIGAMQQQAVLQDGTSCEAVERERWRKIVSHVFDDVPHAAAEIFQQLWEHFADARHWRLDERAVQLWQHVRQRGLMVGVASNFDRRLLNICRHLPPLCDSKHVYCSSLLGFAKPDRRFYRQVEQRTGLSGPQILMIGDDLLRDVQAPRELGWQTVHWPLN